MKIINYILLLSVTAFACTPQIISPQSSNISNIEKLEWSETRKLAWGDFAGTPSGDLIDNAAVTNCGFGYSSNKITVLNKPKITVSNIFNRNLSWVKSSQLNRLELLEHEQLHFDISELYARKLRKEFAEANLSYFNVKRRTENIFNEVHKQYLQRQKDYEDQSNYSLNITRQKEWVNAVRVELNALRGYAK